MELQVGVKILIHNEAGKYLFLKRNPEKYPESQKWDIPGGRIDPGSSLLENLQREVSEETGMTIVGKPRLIAAQDILKVPGRHVVRLTYEGTALGEPVLSEEHIDVKWMDTSEMHAEERLDSFVKALLEEGLIH